MSHSLPKKLFIGTIAPIVFASSCFAADISHSLRNNTQENDQPENYFELGVSAGAGIGPSLTDEDGKGFGAGLVVNGSYNWNGFFVDVFGESRDPVVFGYNAYNDNNWSFDVILAPLFNGFDEDTDDRFIGIDDRDSTMMFGGRLTGYLGRNTVQFTLKHDIAGTHNGTTASALIGRNWQHRNWNFHGMVGLAFSDAKINDYYLGVTEEEAARTNFSAFDAGAKISASSEIGVTYPITEDWIYRATVRLGASIDGKPESPLFANDRAYWSSFNTSISYVF